MGRWKVLDDQAWWGLGVTAAVVGLGGAVVEALGKRLKELLKMTLMMMADLGVDDNLTLPILSGAIIWLWLGFTNLVL